MTRLVASITAPTTAELRARVAQALAAGADGVELRLDHLDPRTTPAEVARVFSTMAPGTWIATLRSTDEGGRCALPDAERLAFLLEATSGRDGYIDFEYRATQIEPCRTAWLAAAAGRRWILSYHDFQSRPDDVPGLARGIAAVRPGVIAKVAWQGRTLSDNVLALRAMRELGDRVIAVVMGDVCLASRVLAGKLGAAATYCAPAVGSQTAPGQLALDDLLHTYRWRSITPATRVYGVLGDPVRHSLSPVLFNRVFERCGFDAVYLPWLATGGERALAELLAQCEENDWLDIDGFSVTLPHKQAARRFVGDRIEPLAARLGAVNTLVRRDGRFYGYNTDYAGALDALCHGLGTAHAKLRGLTVDVLGAGGAARALVAGLADCGCRVTLYNRTPDSAELLASEFDCDAAPWEERTRRAGRVVINCTPAGMWPNLEQTPMPAEALRDQPVVFDTVYRPMETRLLREAKQAGCRTVNGVEMFVRQAAAQFEIWFGRAADVNAMREAALDDLARSSAAPGGMLSS